MKIEQYIREELITRLERTGVLVVYDADRRYRELCLLLAADKRCVIDASESSIEAREQAMHAFQKIANQNSGVVSLVVYVPVARPLSDEERQQLVKIVDNTMKPFENMLGNIFHPNHRPIIAPTMQPVLQQPLPSQPVFQPVTGFYRGYMRWNVHHEHKFRSY